MGSSFGFEVPTGDPGALHSAATTWRQLGVALDDQGQAIAAGSQTALGTGGWTGTAASAFTDNATRLIDTVRSGVQACGTAAGALDELANALDHAQQVTRQAQAACARAQTELNAQTDAADQAGRDAATAQLAAATAPHPAAASELQRQADASRRAQGAAQAAAGRAQGELSSQQTRGQQAVTAYEHTARAVVGRLHSAAGELKPVEDLEHNWAEPVVGWGGHVNDFAGAGALGLIKGYDSALAVAAGKLVQETEDVLGDPDEIARVRAGLPLTYDDNLDPMFAAAGNRAGAATSPLTKVLTKGLDEDKFGVLGKVPYLAAGFTAADMFLNRDEGPEKAIVEPLGNLAVSTTIAEGSSTLVAGGITTLAAGDGALAALAGTAVIPGVGEVVIVGAVTVGGTYLVDKGVSWVWNHGGEKVVSSAWNGVKTGVTDVVEHPVSTAKHVLHDIEPWHWG